MAEPLRVLVVEDSENDALLLLRELKRAGYDADHQRVEDVEALREALAVRPWDIVISDYQMPQLTGFDALKLVVESGLDLPFIMVSGTIGEHLAVEAMKSGAADYLMKGNLTRLGPAIRRELAEAEDRRQRRRAERERGVAERRVEHLNRLLQAIRRVNQLIVRERDPARLLQRTCELLVDTRGYAGVWMLLAESSGLSPAWAAFGWGDERAALVDKLAAGCTPHCCQLAQSAGTAVLIERPIDDCRDCALGLVRPERQAIVVALRHDDLVQGCLCASVLEDDLVDAEELSLMDEVAADVAYALHGIGLDRARQEAEGQVHHQAWLLEKVSDAIISTDGDFVIRSWNQAAETMYGWRGDEVIGLPLGDVVTPEYLTASRERALLDISESGRWEGEVLHRRKDGEVMSVWGSVNRLHDRHGQPIGAVCANRDISERKRAEATLRQSEERFRTIFDGVRDGILVVEPASHEVLMANQTMCAMLGCDRDDLLGSTVADLHPADDLPRVLAVYERQVLDGDSLATNIPVQRRDGSVFLADVNAQLLELDGKSRLMGAFRDVTERERMRAQLAQSDRMASVGMLAAGVAHEINNPLTYVLYNLQSLGDDLPRLADASNRLQQALGAAKSSEVLGADRAFVGADHVEDLLAQAREAAQGASRIRDIVKDLRTFSHVDDGRVVPVAINETIESAINLAFNEIKYRARLTKHLGDVPDVKANDGKLAQVFLNLLVNAAHAIDEGDRDGNEIQVRTRLDGEQVIAEISDSGKGIAPENLSRLFEPFFTTKEAGVGSGLGLSICHNIVTGLGGAIEVTSEVGIGSTFTVRLPLQGADQLGSVVPCSSDEPPPSRFRGRVLVVDDEPNIGLAMKRILSAEHDVEVVGSGAEAMELLGQDAELDVILCDLIMPEVSGMDLHEWLVEHHPELATRVIFVSGGAFTPRARAFLRQVENVKLEKPVAPQVIRATVREAIETRWAGD